MCSICVCVCVDDSTSSSYLYSMLCGACQVMVAFVALNYVFYNDYAYIACYAYSIVVRSASKALLAGY